MEKFRALALTVNAKKNLRKMRNFIAKQSPYFAGNPYSIRTVGMDRFHIFKKRRRKNETVGFNNDHNLIIFLKKKLKLIVIKL